MYNSLTQQPAWLQQWLIISLTIFTYTPVHAQITPDNTLGSETSRIAPNTLINNASSDLINGGAQRGSNLFHSFGQFNINDGQRVYFGNPSGVENIFTRVTGGSASNILGTLGVNGLANLFLMNPNGILFGKNASLDVRGSFVGTTANAIGFGNQGFFSSTNPEAPPLLTINPSALLFNQLQANAGITNLSQAPAGVNPIGQNVTGLRVADGKSIALVGGGINLDGGAIKAYSGRIELTSLAAPGAVGLNDTFSLNIPNVERGNISLTNGAEVNVRGTDAGSIVINAQNLTLAGGSKLRAGIDIGLGTLQSKAGNIVINTTGSTVLSDGSFIANVLESNSTGMSGNININTGSLAMTDNSSFNTTTYGNGNGGNVSIKAADTVFLNSSAIFNGVETGSVGNGGNLIVDAGSISLRNGSEFNSKTSGQGNAGNISINSPDISIDGKNNQIFSRVISAVNPEGVGKVGNIQIATNSFKVTGGAFISGDVLGKGDGGNITIDARDTVDLDGDSFISTIIRGEAITRGGDIQITTGSLSLTNGAQIYTSVFGKGNAGDITINARNTVKLDGVSVYDVAGGITSGLFAEGVGKAGNIQITTGSLLVTNGSQIASDTSGRGDAGNITINARDKVAFEGFGGSVWFSRASTSASFANNNSVANAGDIQITTGELLLKDGGNIAAFNDGQGNGGNIILDVANTTTFDGFSANTGLPSAASTFTINSKGNAGNIQLKTGSLFLTNGGLINTSASGTGNSGKITIDARDRINIDGVFINVGKSFNLISGLGSISLGEGRAGDIEITTGSLSLTNGAIISSSTSSRGNAGNITINARDTVTFDGAKDGFSSNASSQVFPNGVGNGGDIRISAKALFLTNGGAINAFSSGQGNAGNIFLDTSDNINIDGVGSNGLPSSISAYSSRDGKGGDITIQSGRLSVSRGAFISSSGAGAGNAGDININSGLVRLDGSAIAAETNSTNGGNINLTATDILQLRRGGTITTTAGFSQAGGDGGNINIDTPFIVAVPSENSDIAANAFSGKGGSININTQGIFGIEARPEPTDESDITASSKLGVQGQVTIQEPDIQPAKSIVELPRTVIDASNQFAQICPSPTNPNRLVDQFVVTGRGSLPPNPLQPLSPKPGMRQLVSLDTFPPSPTPYSPLPTPSSPIIEAQGIMKTADGEIILVAQVAQATPTAATTTPACPHPNQKL